MRTWTFIFVEDFQIHILVKLQYLGKDGNIIIDKNEHCNGLQVVISTCTRAKGQLSKAIKVKTAAYFKRAEKI